MSLDNPFGGESGSENSSGLLNLIRRSYLLWLIFLKLRFLNNLLNILSINWISPNRSFLDDDRNFLSGDI